MQTMNEILQPGLSYDELRAKCLDIQPDHDAFLDGLSQQLDQQTQLSTPQKNALQLIIEKMKQHLTDRVRQQRAAEVLTQERANMERYPTVMSTLEEANLGLKADLVTLQARYDELNKRRAGVRTAIFIALPIAALLVAMSAFFLPVLIGTIVSVAVGVALVALGLATIFIAVQAAMKNAEVESCRTAIASSDAQLITHNGPLSILAATRHAEIAQEEAIQIAAASLQEANNITVNDPSASVAHYSNGRFFQAETISEEEEEDYSLHYSSAPSSPCI
jgi:hypothetical protein